MCTLVILRRLLSYMNRSRYTYVNYELDPVCVPTEYAVSGT